MISILNINTIDRKEWQYLVKSSEMSSPFQTPEYYDFCTSLSFLKPFVFGVLENKILQGIILGYIISEEKGLKSFFSRRAIIHGGPLLSKSISNDALETLLRHTQKILSKKSLYIETRNYFDYSKYKVSFEKVGFVYEEHLNFRVDTSDREIAFGNLSTTKRRDVRISMKNGATIITNPTQNEIEEYYNMLNDMYRNKIKLPVFPIEFFINLVKKKMGKFFMIKHNDVVLGGSVCIELKNKVLYELFVCGADRKIKNVYPSTLATWAAIEYASENGFQYFDMMGAGKPNDGYGVRNFKSKFGGELVEFGRYTYICNKVFFQIGKMGLRILQRLKK